MKKLVVSVKDRSVQEINMSAQEIADFEKEAQIVQQQKDNHAYQQDRLDLYLPLGQVADALFKQRLHVKACLLKAEKAQTVDLKIQALIEALQSVPELQAVDDHTQQVKLRCPKPESQRG